MGNLSSMAFFAAVLDVFPLTISDAECMNPFVNASKMPSSLCVL